VATSLATPCIQHHAYCSLQTDSCKQSGKRDSNPRPQPWQGCALPTELFPQTCPTPERQSEPDRPRTSTTKRHVHEPHRDGGEGNRTPDLLNAIQALSQLSYAPGRNAPARETPKGVRQRGRQEPRSLVGCMSLVKQMHPRQGWRFFAADVMLHGSPALGLFAPKAHTARYLFKDEVRPKDHRESHD